MNNAYSILLFGTASLVASCEAPTGDWNRDSIFYDPRLAEKKIADLQGTLNSENRSIASKNIERVHLERKREALMRQRDITNSQLASIRNETISKREELDQVRTALANLPETSPEADALRLRIDGLVSDIRRLDALHLSLQD
jgi:hypothetical protein